MDVVSELRRLGWSVEERSGGVLRLPQEVLTRYPQLPATLIEFLGRVVSCVNSSETAWFLCEADFSGTGESAYCWNEWEIMSLEAADGDEQLLSVVRSFWDSHFPFFMSVADGYSYYAVDTSQEGFGQIVTGCEPEFEDAEIIAESFERFLVDLIARDGLA